MEDTQKKENQKEKKSIDFNANNDKPRNKKKYSKLSKTTLLIAILGLIAYIPSKEYDYMLIEFLSQLLMGIGIIGTAVLLFYDFQYKRKSN